MCVVLVALLAGFVGLIRGSDADSRQALAGRFLARSELTGSFARSFVHDLAERERTQAERLLGAASVDQAAFESVVHAFEFEAAVLLDGDGRLLQVWPPKPEIIGRDMTIDYEHLRNAVAGRIGVSEMVPSAARAVPIAAVAVPFESAAGRRVLSGAFSPSASPLGLYLDSIVPISNGAAYLVDGSGDVLAGSEATAHDIELLAALPMGVTDIDLSFGEATVAVSEVPDTPWRAVLVAPSAALYEPVTSQAASWALWAAAAAAGLMSIGLFVRLGRARAEAATMARTDLLTGLANRRAVHESLARAAALSARHGVPVAALMIDLDDFKLINDVHGHDAGDRVLRSVGGVLADTIRDSDLAGRWGGEEFVVLLAHADELAALGAAERIRELIASTPMGGQHITASIGAAVLRDASGGDALMRQADIALYTAKSSGRNRVEIFALPDAPDWVSV